MENCSDFIWIYSDGFSREIFLPKILLKFKKEECVIKFYTNEGDVVDTIEKHNLWEFFHPSIDSLQVNRVRVTKEYYYVLYYLKEDIDFERIKPHISKYVDNDVKNYSVEYSYE